ncbi:MAG: hypothetical protein U5N53_23195 [Mycobacterium sp.]|nr:hypothetical protein [Mycobacterium sp.]
MDWGSEESVQTMSSSPMPSSRSTGRSAGSTWCPTRRCPRCSGCRSRRSIPWPGRCRCSARPVVRSTERRMRMWRQRADVELSMMQIRRNVAEQLDCVRGERYPDAELMLRTRRDQVMAADRALHAVEVVVDDPGIEPDEPLLERIWRDVQTARMHVASNVEQVLTVVGRHSVGIAVDDLIW